MNGYIRQRLARTVGAAAVVGGPEEYAPRS
jgi:hypothetical protein